jgi:hypothetical protein
MGKRRLQGVTIPRVAKGKAAYRAHARRSRLKRELRKKASAVVERVANVPVQTRNNHELRIRKERTDGQFDLREVRRSYRSSVTMTANPVSSPNSCPCRPRYKANTDVRRQTFEQSPDTTARAWSNQSPLSSMRAIAKRSNANQWRNKAH